MDDMTAPTGTLPVVRYDIFPARVTDAITGSALYASVRVVVTLDSVFIFDESQQAIYTAALDDGWETRAGGLKLEPADGTHPFFVVRSGGCGCGSRLKSFRPWNGNYTVTNTRLPMEP